MENARVYVPAPVTTPLRGGLLAVATVIDATDPHVGLGVEWQPEACGPALVDIDRCNPPTNTITFETVLDDATLTVAEPPEDEEITVDWGDDSTDDTDTSEDGSALEFTHTYTEFGLFTVTVSGATFGTRTLDVRVSSSASFSTSSTAKVFESGSVLEGSPFTVFKGVECDAFSDEETARARRGLELGEGRAVESVVWDTILATSEAQDLTPAGGAASPKVAMSILEGYAGEMYGGVATLHVPRSLVPVLPGLEMLDPGQIVTKQGTKIANGAGYTSNRGPDGEIAAAGEAWLYVTGEVVLHRTSPEVHEVVDQRTNRRTALAERIYVPGVECFVGAVRLTLEGL